MRFVAGSVIAIALAVLTSNIVEAQPKKLDTIKTWNGSVADVALQKLAPKNGVITKEMVLKQIWEKWNVKGDAPKIDFKKQLVLVAVTRGSRMGLTPNLDDKGNLRVLAFGTRDLRPGFRYILATVSRDGIKSVNGKELR